MAKPTVGDYERWSNSPLGLLLRLLDEYDRIPDDRKPDALAFVRAIGKRQLH